MMDHSATTAAVLGFEGEEAAKVRQELERAGWRVTPFASSAEVLILGPAADAALRDDPRSQRWEDWQREHRGRARRPRPAVECGDEGVRVLDVELPRRRQPGRLAPPAERFRELCFDQGFLVCARHAALAAQQGLPLLFEGPTGTAKTTAILWLAHLCGQDLVRLNLNGQTDTGELVGRFLPAADGRRLGWRFGEGAIPQALRHGWWVLLDEVNLAEPQVAERLNPVLEQPPTLLLSEHDGTRFGPGGDVPVHAGFRIFATMNPSEYAGRSPLSPAFRDRWPLWIQVPPVSKEQVLALLRRLVHGVQPEVRWQGVAYRMPDEAPVHPALSALDDEALQRVAQVHDTLCSAAGGGSGDEPAALGRTRRERYVFTRRSLLTALRLAAREAEAGAAPLKALGRALRLVYVERIADEGERSAALSTLRAAGFTA